MQDQDENQEKKGLFEQKVDTEAAIKDVTRWLDRKKVTPRVREQYKDHIDTLVEAVELGYISIDDGGKIRQELQWPIADNDGTVSITTLEYKPRVTSEAIQVRTANVKPTDVEGRINAYIAALTGKPAALIGKLDKGMDGDIARSIASFFM